MKNPGQAVVTVGGHGISFMMDVFEDGKAALGGGGGARKTVKRMLSAAENKLRLAAKKLEAAKGWIGDIEKHHIFPQAKELCDLFRSAGINIHEFTFELNIHNIHNKGIVNSLGLNWNRAWEEWLSGYEKMHGKLLGKLEILA